MKTNIIGKVAIIATTLGIVLGASIIGCSPEGPDEGVVVGVYPAACDMPTCEGTMQDAGSECLQNALDAQGDAVAYCCDDSAAKPGDATCMHEWRARCNEVAVHTSADIYKPGGVSCFQDGLTWVCCENP